MLQQVTFIEDRNWMCQENDYWLSIAESPPHGGFSIPEVHERDQ
jgi:hypothetical protein